MNTNTLDNVLDGLMRRYLDRVPDVAAILTAMQQEGLIDAPEAVQNDHIAFRTMGVPQLGIQSLEKIFLHYGYTRQDAYHFPAKKLDAYWYAPPTPAHPRIFISELRVPELSSEAQQIIHSYTDEVVHDPVLDLNLDDWQVVDDFLHRGLWRLPTSTDFTRLQAESEYAAWVIYNRYYLNHYTISVHELPAGYNTIPEFNAFLTAHGFQLNSAGGEVKTSADGLLRQSSTVAEMIGVTFADGVTQEISGSYVEFAERRVLPQFARLPPETIMRQHRREGFEAGNADKIFESTYTEQTDRRRAVG